MFISALIHIFCFYTVTCPPLRLGEKDDPRDATNNTSLLTDELHSGKGYSVNTMASFPCLKFKLGDKHKFSSVICQSSGKWGQQIPTCDTGNENENLFSTGVIFNIYIVCNKKIRKRT